ncbi:MULTISPECIES: fimbrial protein [Serratia]|uniref:fimbrial protein n=1 Tax=Serratia TaxID=613 RepID=UPI001495EA4B|nr:fimbrial protein [Serratia marcescens]CAI0921609.1 Major MR/P fimbria protein precursor [Serratia marcescens]
MNGHPRFLNTVLIAGLLALSCAAQADNVRLHGALVAEPCVIAPGDENVRLDFGTVIDKYLYTNVRTHGQAFEIHLKGCDLSLGKTVKVTFSGTENSSLKGLLAIEGSSQASGIAIGMETQGGQPLPLNKAGEGYRLASGDNTLTLMAYVQGEPEAIARRTIERGPFSAIATFRLEYE